MSTVVVSLTPASTLQQIEMQRQEDWLEVHRGNQPQVVTKHSRKRELLPGSTVGKILIKSQKDKYQYYPTYMKYIDYVGSQSQEIKINNDLESRTQSYCLQIIRKFLCDKEGLEMQIFVLYANVNIIAFAELCALKVV